MLLGAKNTKNMWGLDFTLRGRQRTSLGLLEAEFVSWCQGELISCLFDGYQTAGVSLTMIGE